MKTSNIILLVTLIIAVCTFSIAANRLVYKFSKGDISITNHLKEKRSEIADYNGSLTLPSFHHIEVLCDGKLVVVTDSTEANGKGYWGVSYEVDGPDDVDAAKFFTVKNDTLFITQNNMSDILVYVHNLYSVISEASDNNYVRFAEVSTPRLYVKGTNSANFYLNNTNIRSLYLELWDRGTFTFQDFDESLRIDSIKVKLWGVSRATFENYMGVVTQAHVAPHAFLELRGNSIVAFSKLPWRKYLDNINGATTEAETQYEREWRELTADK